MQREAGKEGIPLQKRVLEVGRKKALGGESAEGSRKVGNSSAREVAVVGFVCRGKQEKRGFLCKKGAGSGREEGFRRRKCRGKWRKRGFLCKVEAEKSKVEER